jgi:hypothetical protein
MSLIGNVSANLIYNIHRSRRNDLFGGDALSQQHRAHDIQYTPLMSPAKGLNHALFARRN